MASVNIIQQDMSPSPTPLGNNDNNNNDNDLMMMDATTNNDPSNNTMMTMMMMENNNNNTGDDNAIMALEDDDDDDIVCCNNATTMTQCEEDRKLLEAFLNETDIDLIEGGLDEEDNDNDHPLRNSVSTTTSSSKVRQVSDGTTATTTNTTTMTVNTTTTPTPPQPVTTTTTTLTGRPPIQLYLSCNPDHLSEYQCLIRKHIELFEATEMDVNSRIKGRNKPIVLGQVGIRCMHCRHVLPEQRGRGAMYYPHKLSGIYQAAQILSQGHLMNPNNICGFIPPSLQQELQRLKAIKSEMTTAGKDYWAETARALGVYEDDYGLRFEERLGMVRHSHHPNHHH